MLKKCIGMGIMFPANWITGNVGFVFTNSELKEIRDKITSNRVAAPARAGAIAPLDVSCDTMVEPQSRS